MTDKVFYDATSSKMLGYEDESSSEFAQETFSRIHSEDVNLFTEALNSHVADNTEHFEVIVRFLTKDEVWKWVLIAGRAVRENDTISKFSGVMVNIDNLKNHEIELKELSEHLLYLNKELREFAFIASHILRAPVANLLSLVDLFQKEELSESNKTLFDKIDFSVNKLNTTLIEMNEIISLRTAVTHEITQVSFSEVVNMVLGKYSNIILQQNITIATDFSKAELVNYNPKLLEIIFITTIANAIKFRKTDEALSIKIYTDKDEAGIKLHIKDNGLGFDAEKYHQKIFGLYQTFHQGISGKGLSLYMLKHHVEYAKGSIKVISKPDVGAEFIIIFKS